MVSPDVLRKRGRRRSARAEDPVLLVGSNGRGRVRLVASGRSPVLEMTPDQAEGLAGKLFEAAVRIRTGWPAGGAGDDDR